MNWREWFCSSKSTAHSRFWPDIPTIPATDAEFGHRAGTPDSAGEVNLRDMRHVAKKV